MPIDPNAASRRFDFVTRREPCRLDSPNAAKTALEDGVAAASYSEKYSIGVFQPEKQRRGGGSATRFDKRVLLDDLSDSRTTRSSVTVCSGREVHLDLSLDAAGFLRAPYPDSLLSFRTRTFAWMASRALLFQR